MCNPDDVDAKPFRVELVRVEEGCKETVVYQAWVDRRNLPMVGRYTFGVALPDLFVFR